MFVFFVLLCYFFFVGYVSLSH